MYEPLLHIVCIDYFKYKIKYMRVIYTYGSIRTL